jgi:mannosyltransferase OCH1-like enzyme
MNYINYMNYKLVFLVLCILLIFYLLNKSLINEKEFFDNQQKIPKIIIQTWKSKDIPDKYKEDIDSLKKYNSDFEFLFFDDNDIETFLKNNYPQYYESYIKLPVKIQKIDYFRYIAVYHYGGFYFDLDMSCFYPLEDLLNYDCIFPVDDNLNGRKCNKVRFNNMCNNNMKVLLGQYAFGAKPRNEFIKLLIDNIHNNVDKYIEDYKKKGNKRVYVYVTTGPDFVTNLYMNYSNKSSIHILEYEDGQYFGKYAKHNQNGTWK